MTRPEVWLFGNPDLPQDSLPLRLKTQLEVELPNFIFKIVDPLDNWPKTDKLIIIDTVVGLAEIKVFASLQDFGRTPLVSVHDFDLKSELELRAKLGLLPTFIIIGLPPTMSEAEALAKLKPILLQYSK